MRSTIAVSRLVKLAAFAGYVAALATNIPWCTAENGDELTLNLRTSLATCKNDYNISSRDSNIWDRQKRLAEWKACILAQRAALKSLLNDALQSRLDSSSVFLLASVIDSEAQGQLED